MQPAFILSCAALSFISLSVAAWGGRMLIADRKLEARLARLTDAPGGSGKAKLRLPALLGTEGRDRSKLELQLQLAGYQDARAVNYFLWLRLTATAASALLITFLSRIFWGQWLARPMLIVIGAGLVFIGARQALTLLASARTQKITAEFPS